MIQTVSNFSARDSKIGVLNHRSKTHYMSGSPSFNQLPDSFTSSKHLSQIAFNGTPLNLVKGERKLGSKISRFTSEAKEAIGDSLNKLKGKNDLPVTEKPIIAPKLVDNMDDLAEGLPIAGGIRTINGIRKGDKKSIVKGSVAAADNIVLQPVKQTVAGAAAAKGAAVGAVLGGPAGAAVGAVIGYVGTLWGWGKIRNKIVDGCMDE